MSFRSEQELLDVLREASQHAVVTERDLARGRTRLTASLFGDRRASQGQNADVVEPNSVAESDSVESDSVAKPIILPIRRAALAFALVSAAVALLALGMRSWRSVPTALLFDIVSDGQRTAGVAQALIETTFADTALEFQGGTRFDLARGARLRVLENEGIAATLGLESGTVVAELMDRTEAREPWWVRAGPFQVRADSGRFDVSWNPGSKSFRLAMVRGQAWLTGPKVGAQQVRAGQIVDISLLDDETTRAPTSVTMPFAAPVHDAPASIDPLGRAHTRSRSNLPPTTIVEENTTPHLDRTGTELGMPSCADALLEGFALRAAHELLALADACRAQRRFAEAESIYRALIERFDGEEESVRALFQLGRLTFRTRPEESLRFFDRYIRSAEEGAFLRDAMGRALELSAGREDQAARATEYLRRFAHGPHARLAQAVLRDHDSTIHELER